MPERTPDRLDARWTRANLAALAVLCLAAAGALAGQMLGGRSELGARPRVDAARVAAAADKVNPNTAPVASLRRLPDVGPVRAGDIVAYRLVHGGAPFRRPEDLLRVRGIGPITLATIREYLVFP